MATTNSPARMPNHHDRGDGWKATRYPANVRKAAIRNVPVAITGKAPDNRAMSGVCAVNQSTYQRKTRAADPPSVPVSIRAIPGNRPPLVLVRPLSWFLPINSGNAGQ